MTTHVPYLHALIAIDRDVFTAIARVRPMRTMRRWRIVIIIIIIIAVKSLIVHVYVLPFSLSSSPSSPPLPRNTNLTITLPGFDWHSTLPRIL